VSGRRGTRVGDEIRQTRPFRSTSQEAAVATMRTADDLRRHFGGVVEPHGLTLQQYNVLRILRGARGTPLPTLEIGERLIERTPGVTRLLDRLATKGLVRRERSAEDRRQVNGFITESGLELLEELDGAIDSADDVLRDSLDEDELRQLVVLLDRVREAVRARGR
jgi:DNA-binding MarR family transcriptional regulator